MTKHICAECDSLVWFIWIEGVGLRVMVHYTDEERCSRSGLIVLEDRRP